MKGVITLEVKLYLETDLTEEQIEEVVEDLDYNFDHPLVVDSEITESE